ncbi:unnamed protein product [Cylicocyclus nassatus]|uniref:Uncharacterized protein n=1 Tax=Cylicocyclus nassatus TaxID=53992 RepID=A0AA36M4M9_CYLNA|nr:unnamed protein product [Cylicocyclus nassatus]
MPPRKGKRSKKTTALIDVKKSGPEQWDAIRYHHPKKLDEPCARTQSDGEWFPIERILDTIYIVGTNRMWQHLVQWKPSWSRQVTPSALRDFHAKATVLGCIVKDETLRSRVRQKIEWNRREFMCSDFAVRITDPDGTSTVEVLPYPDVKRRFPSALFEFLEDRVPIPRSKVEDEARSDGLLSVYDDVNIPECLKRDPDAQKMTRNVTVNQNVKDENGDSVSALSACVANSGNKKIRKRKEHKYYKGARRIKRKSNVVKMELDEANTSDRAAVEVCDRTSHLEMTDSVEKRVSPSSAKEFLDKLQSATSENSLPTKSPPSRVTLSISIESPKSVDLHISKNEDDDVVIIYDKESPCKIVTSTEAKTASSLETKSSPSVGATMKDQRLNAERVFKRSGDEACSKTATPVKRVSPRLSSGSNSSKRNISHGKQHRRKRSAPLKSRNSLDDYFGQSHHRKQHRLSGEENGPHANGLSNGAV